LPISEPGHRQATEGWTKPDQSQVQGRGRRGSGITERVPGTEQLLYGAGKLTPPVVNRLRPTLRPRTGL